MVDIERLNRIVDGSGLKKRSIAKKMHISESSLCNKLSGTSPFKLNDVECMRDIFHIGCRDLVNIFFATNVERQSTEE